MKPYSLTRPSATIKQEISWLTARIQEREAWLDNPRNRQRATWEEVLVDTYKMQRHLEDLFLELSDALSNEQNP